MTFRQVLDPIRIKFSSRFPSNSSNLRSNPAISPQATRCTNAKPKLVPSNIPPSKSSRVVQRVVRARKQLCRFSTRYIGPVSSWRLAFDPCPAAFKFFLLSQVCNFITRARPQKLTCFVAFRAIPSLGEAEKSSTSMKRFSVLNSWYLNSGRAVHECGFSSLPRRNTRRISWRSGGSCEAAVDAGLVLMF